MSSPLAGLPTAVFLRGDSFIVFQFLVVEPSMSFITVKTAALRPHPSIDRIPDKVQSFQNEVPSPVIDLQGKHISDNPKQPRVGSNGDIEGKS